MSQPMPTEKATRRCVFCHREGRKLTNEHVLPIWLSEALPGTERFTTTHESTLTSIRRAPRVTDEIDVKVRRACDECNQGWMSRLEVRAATVLRPMIRGERRVVLDRKDQRAVAAWAAKVAMLWGFAGAPPTPPQQWELAHLYRYHEAPKSTYVWVGSFDGGTRDAVRLWHHHLELSATGLGTNTPEGDLLTMRVGYVGLQVYRLPRPGSHGRKIGIIGRDPESLLRIWPTAADRVHWPPPPLTDRQWESIGRRFLTNSKNELFRPVPVR